MKMALQYQQSLGKSHKHKFMTLRKGYHGDTTGAMSVCDPIGGMHHIFANYLPQHFFTEQPQSRFGESLSPNEKQNLEKFFESHHTTSAAFILEPIVQGAGGMWFYTAAFLQEVRRLCDHYGLLLIADEIATGFGRTGELFASNHADICPDIMAVGKALTGGYMTLAATLCTPKVADTICRGEAGVFMHGPTFMGNPLACAVAIRSLDLLLEQDWKAQVKRIENRLHIGLVELRDDAAVRDVRILGGIGVVELHSPINVAHAQAFLISRGVWIRPFRNLLYVMPPYIIDDNDLNILTTAMADYVRLSTS
jgi:adenosylmethionine-8-amino-7-oxononanoate aminotransferase